LAVLSAAVQAKTVRAHVPHAGDGGRLFLSRPLGRLGSWGRLQPRVHVTKRIENCSLCGVGSGIRPSSVLHVLHGKGFGGVGTEFLWPRQSRCLHDRRALAHWDRSYIVALLAAAALLDWVNPRWVCVLGVCSHGRYVRVLDGPACEDNIVVYWMGFYDHSCRGGDGALAREWHSADSLTRPRATFRPLGSFACGFAVHEPRARRTALPGASRGQGAYTCAPHIIF